MNIFKEVWILIGKLVFLKWLKREKSDENLDFVVAELMLLGFISLLLTVFQGAISKFCIPEDIVNSMLPCKRPEADSSESEHSNATTTTSHFQRSFTPVTGMTRHLLSEGSSSGYCAKKVNINNAFTRTSFSLLV